MNDERLAQLVTPFYLAMMRLNALESDESMLCAVAHAGREASPAEVVQLLRSAWRPRVMGAWYALLHDDPDIPGEVLASLASSEGSLTSPPLAVAAAVLTGAGSIGALERYAAIDVVREFGACGFVAAAIEHVGGTANACRPSADDLAHFDGLLHVAKRLRAIQ